MANNSMSNISYGSDSDDYELMPRQELDQLRREVTSIKKGSLVDGDKAKVLMQSMDNLTIAINRLITILEDAQKDIIDEYQNSKPAEKLNQIMDQNETIAKALLTVNDTVTSLKNGMSVPQPQPTGFGMSPQPNTGAGLGMGSNMSAGIGPTIGAGIGSGMDSRSNFLQQPTVQTTQQSNISQMSQFGQSPPGMNMSAPKMSGIPSNNLNTMNNMNIVQAQAFNPQPIGPLQGSFQSSMPGPNDLPPLDALPPMDAMPGTPPKKKFLGII